MKNLQTIIDQINDLSTEDLVSVNNAYCRGVNYNDDEIYNNDEDFFETFFSNRVLEAVRAISYGTFNYCDDYVKFNGYGNLDSFTYFAVEELPVTVEEISEYAINNPEEFDMLDFDLQQEED